MPDVRFHAAGLVSHLRSQTIYHGLAHAHSEGSPDTVVIATPEEPYVCVGFHQDIDRELDVEACERLGLPVLRRETGGGAVYLDANQLFVQWIMSSDSLPVRVEQRFELFARPLVETYLEFGIDAEFRPVNDVQVDGRKISGTGAAKIGEAEVLVGNFILDFDNDVMARVLRAPSAEFREQVAASLDCYMTSMRAEGVAVPHPSELAVVYREKCAAALGRPLSDGELTPEEEAHIEAADARFRSPEFLCVEGGLRRPGVKIHEDVHVIEVERGPRRVTARVRSGRIEEVALSHGAVRHDALAAHLRGVELAPDPVRTAVKDYHEDRRDERDEIGPEVTGWVDAILDLRDPSRGNGT